MSMIFCAGVVLGMFSDLTAQKHNGSAYGIHGLATQKLRPFENEDRNLRLLNPK